MWRTISCNVSGPGYAERTNQQILCMPQIETRTAIDNLEAILDVPGIDAVYVGPTDLGLSLGLPPLMDRTEPDILKLYDRMILEAKKRGKFAVLHCGAAKYARFGIDKGFQMVTVGMDMTFMLFGAKAAVAETRGE